MACKLLRIRARSLSFFFLFFFNDPATTEIYTLSLHDALPISAILTTSVAALRVLQSRIPKPNFVCGHSLGEYSAHVCAGTFCFADAVRTVRNRGKIGRDTSELQSHVNLVCRLLLEKKNKKKQK